MGLVGQEVLRTGLLEARKIERETKERVWYARNPLGTPPGQTNITGMFFHMRLFNQDTVQHEGSCGG